MTGAATPTATGEIAAVDLERYAHGNTGVPHAWSFTAARPGPHVLALALMHGNETAGAQAVADLLDRGLRPVRGRLSFVFAHPGAHAAGREATGRRPVRFVEEDMNRVWTVRRLQAAASLEAARAAALLPLLASADRLLDLHTMQTDAPPLILSGSTEKARRVAAALGCPGWVIADRGHAAGQRLIDHVHFADRRNTQVALLLEAGGHGRLSSLATSRAVLARFLEVTGAIEPGAAGPAARPGPQLFVEVTHAVTAQSDQFVFVEPFRGLEILARAGTLIARDGARPVLTPYAGCVLVMPAPRARPGQTAVRLGRLVPPPEPPG